MPPKTKPSEPGLAKADGMFNLPVTVSNRYPNGTIAGIIQAPIPVYVAKGQTYTDALDEQAEVIAQAIAKMYEIVGRAHQIASAVDLADMV